MSEGADNAVRLARENMSRLNLNASSNNGGKACVAVTSLVNEITSSENKEARSKSIGAAGRENYLSWRGGQRPEARRANEA